MGIDDVLIGVNKVFVSSYNNQAFDDLLIIQCQPSDDQPVDTKTKNNITVIYSKEDQTLLGINIFQISNYLSDLTDGPVTLTEDQVRTVNDLLAQNNFDIQLEADESPKFVIGFVKECKPHEDSDHLNITQTEVDDGKVLQIVCGAKNIASGQKVVVAKPGAVMPNGLVIWPGELRGVMSNGMICSARELGLPKEKHTEGILVLDDNAEIGKEFAF